MLPEQRKRRIVELVRDHDGQSVAALAADLDVSKATIRRDLDDLEGDGLIERSHGGAVPATAVGREQTYGQREVQHEDAKRAIGERAVEELHEGDVVYFDAGTTTIEAARRTPTDLSLLTATNSPLLALELADREIDVTLSGGTLRPQTRALVGPSARSFLDGRNFDVALLGTNAIDEAGTLSTPDDGEAQVKRLAIERSERIAVVADASKFGQRSYVEFGDLEGVDLLITDEFPGGPLGTLCEDTGVDVAEVAAR